MACCCVNKLCSDSNSMMDNISNSSCGDNTCGRSNNLFFVIQDKIRSDSDCQLSFLLCLASLFSVLAGWG